MPLSDYFFIQLPDILLRGLLYSCNWVGGRQYQSGVLRTFRFDPHRVFHFKLRHLLRSFNRILPKFHFAIHHSLANSSYWHLASVTSSLDRQRANQILCAPWFWDSGFTCQHSEQSLLLLPNSECATKSHHIEVSILPCHAWVDQYTCIARVSPCHPDSGFSSFLFPGWEQSQAKHPHLFLLSPDWVLSWQLAALCLMKSMTVRTLHLTGGGGVSVYASFGCK